MPNIFQNNWNPQIMPSMDMAIANDFANFNLNNLPPQLQAPDEDFAEG